MSGREKEGIKDVGRTKVSLGLIWSLLNIRNH